MYAHRIPAEQILSHFHFADLAFPLSNKCQIEEELILTIDSLNLDAIIVGSDALFKYVPLNKCRYFSKRRLKYIYNFTPLSCERIEGNPFFGDFLRKLQKKIPAATYAVSSQNCPFEVMTRKEKAAMRNALSNYLHITVRDAWTKKMIENITKTKDINIFPDPVFSFNKNCYLPIPSKQEILDKYGLADNYVLYSFSNWHVKEEYITAIAEELERQNFLPVALPMPEKLFPSKTKHHINLPLDPLDWYALIIHSKGFIGERMHPIVVCLHNVIPFYSFDEYGIFENKGFFSKKQVYNPSSSKTYLIVSDAGLLKNLHSYKEGLPLPTPQYVVNAILAFDSAKCKSFASLNQKKYENGMKEVLESLS